MLRISLLIAMVFFIGASHLVNAQDAGQRTQALVAALDKTKYKKKEKANISIEIYVDVKNEAVVRSPSDYAGTYRDEDGENSLELRISSGGVSGSGSEEMIDGGRTMRYTLRDASINGALLTATKVYENGEQRALEAVFVNRTVSAGKNANQIESRDTKFGLGFIQTGSSSDSESGKHQAWTSRIFLERR